MKERPILFNGEMVRAILDGRKTQTRRVVFPLVAHPEAFDDLRREVNNGMAKFWNIGASKPAHIWWCRYGEPGDRFWVRETFTLDHLPGFPDVAPCVHYQAAHPHPVVADSWAGRWRPSIHMPRWASRIKLEIVNVRVERLRDITEDDARAEGVETHELAQQLVGSGVPNYRLAFAALWNEINGKKPGRSWGDNPWVWAITFKRCNA